MPAWPSRAKTCSHFIVRCQFLRRVSGENGYAETLRRIPDRGKALKDAITHGTSSEPGVGIEPTTYDYKT